MSRSNRLNAYILIVILLSCFLLLLYVSKVVGDYLTTPTPVPTQISMPQPPLNIEQLQALMTDVKGCYLPCFWGFIPNYTSAKDVIEFVQPKEDFTKLKDYDIRYQFPKGGAEEAKISISFTVKDKLLSNLEVTLYNPSDWLPENTFQLSYFLQQMSTIPDVYLSINNGQGRIFLEVAYVDTGIVIQYPITLKVSGNIVSPTVDEPYLFCPQLKLEDPIHLWLQNGDGQALVEQTVQPDTRPNHIWSPKQMTGLSTEAFIQKIIKHPTECIDMLSYPELAKRGYEF